VVNDQIVQEAVRVILPTIDNQQAIDRVHCMAVPWSWRLALCADFLPLQLLDILKIHLPDVIEVAA
jgi:hypothetical protein